MVRRNLQGIRILQDMPEHRIGAQIPVVGLPLAVGLLLSRKLHFALRDLHLIFRVDTVLDLLCGCKDRRRLVCRKRFRLHQVVVFDLSVRPDHQDAYVLEFCAGGLDRFSCRAGGHDGVGMAVDQEVDPGTVLPQIQRTVLSFGGFDIHPQMCEGDDDVRAFLPQILCLFRGKAVHVIPSVEGETDSQGRLCLGLGLFRLKSEESDLQAGFRRIHVAGCQDRRPVLVYIRTEHGEFRFLQILPEGFIAEVKLMITQGRKSITRCIHQVNGIQTFGHVHFDFTLAEIPGIRKDHFRPALLQCIPKRRELRVACDRPVDVIGMQDDNFPREVPLRHRPDILRVLRRKHRA